MSVTVRPARTTPNLMCRWSPTRTVAYGSSWGLTKIPGCRYLRRRKRVLRRRHEAHNGQRKRQVRSLECRLNGTLKKSSLDAAFKRSNKTENQHRYYDRRIDHGLHG